MNCKNKNHSCNSCGEKKCGNKHTTCHNADVVEVVRCKDCEYSYFINSCSKYECRKGCGTLKFSNDFCSYGNINTVILSERDLAFIKKKYESEDN